MVQSYELMLVVLVEFLVQVDLVEEDTREEEVTVEQNRVEMVTVR